MAEGFQGSPGGANAGGKIQHMTPTSSLSRFPLLKECAHFHYETVELSKIKVSWSDEDLKPLALPDSMECTKWFHIKVTSGERSWILRRSWDNFVMLDEQLHQCIYDRKFSQLQDLKSINPEQDMEEALLSSYLAQFSGLIGNMVTCGPVLNWLELDPKGHRLLVADDSAINTPAIAAAIVVTPHSAQAHDELSLQIGDMVSVIDMPSSDESIWWRGKRNYEVGFFPSSCVDIITDKAIPPSILPRLQPIEEAQGKPIFKKHGKLISFFRNFLLNRPSRRKLKESGILRERVFGCDLAEHLLNSGHDIPVVLRCCAEYIESKGIVDGIYRLSGVNSNIQKLRNSFDEDTIPPLWDDESIRQDIHSVASVLKMYFRELPNPLLTYQLYGDFVSAMQGPEETRLLRLRAAVQKLPPPHYRTLEFLMHHLSRVAGHGQKTSMGARNLAIVWAPNLLRCRTLFEDSSNLGLGALQGVGIQAVVTEALIRYMELVFHDGPIANDSGDNSCGTPARRVRPRSLAISTPTKLLTLEEARGKVQGLGIPPDQKYIEVGGGTASLPLKYHTVLELPQGHRRRSSSLRLKRSAWRLFWRSRSSTTANVKNKRSSSGPTCAPALHLQEQAITESDISRRGSKRLRPVKSCESLVSGSGSNRNSALVEGQSNNSSVADERIALASIENHQSLFREDSLYRDSKSHSRTVSHDSYFKSLPFSSAFNEEMIEIRHMLFGEEEDEPTCMQDTSELSLPSDLQRPSEDAKENFKHTFSLPETHFFGSHRSPLADCNAQKSNGKKRSTQSLLASSGLSPTLKQRKQAHHHSVPCDLHSPPSQGGMGFFISPPESPSSMTEKTKDISFESEVVSRFLADLGKPENLFRFPLARNFSDIEEVSPSIERQSEGRKGRDIEPIYDVPVTSKGIATPESPSPYANPFAKTGSTANSLMSSGKTKVKQEQDPANSYSNAFCDTQDDNGCAAVSDTNVELLPLQHHDLNEDSGISYINLIPRKQEEVTYVNTNEQTYANVSSNDQDDTWPIMSHGVYENFSSIFDPIYANVTVTPEKSPTLDVENLGVPAEINDSQSPEGIYENLDLLCKKGETWPLHDSMTAPHDVKYEVMPEKVNEALGRSEESSGEEAEHELSEKDKQKPGTNEELRPQPQEVTSEAVIPFQQRKIFPNQSPRRTQSQPTSLPSNFITPQQYPTYDRQALSLPLSFDGSFRSYPSKTTPSPVQEVRRRFESEIGRDILREKRVCSELERCKPLKAQLHSSKSPVENKEISPSIAHKMSLYDSSKQSYDDQLSEGKSTTEEPASLRKSPFSRKGSIKDLLNKFECPENEHLSLVDVSTTSNIRQEKGEKGDVKQSLLHATIHDKSSSLILSPSLPLVTARETPALMNIAQNAVCSIEEEKPSKISIPCSNSMRNGRKEVHSKEPSRVSELEKDGDMQMQAPESDDNKENEEAKKRERIEKYKEERRSALRQKYKTESKGTDKDGHEVDIVQRIKQRMSSSQAKLSEDENPPVECEEKIGRRRSSSASSSNDTAVKNDTDNGSITEKNQKPAVCPIGEKSDKSPVRKSTSPPSRSSLMPLHSPTSPQKVEFPGKPPITRRSSGENPRLERHAYGRHSLGRSPPDKPPPIIEHRVSAPSPQDVQSPRNVQVQCVTSPLEEVRVKERIAHWTGKTQGVSKSMPEEPKVEKVGSVVLRKAVVIGGRSQGAKEILYRDRVEKKRSGGNDVKSMASLFEKSVKNGEN